MKVNKINKRFRGFLPVVVDVETGGFNHDTDALLEVAAVILQLDEDGLLLPKKTLHFHIEPFAGANLEPAALEFIGMDPHHPLRFAQDEAKALTVLCDGVQAELKAEKCSRAILVGHNAHFDLGFLKAAFARHRMKQSPFHSFTTLDTASLAALMYGQTVLAKSLQAAQIDFDLEQAHSAIYDAEKTAELFCHIINRWQKVIASD